MRKPLIGLIIVLAVLIVSSVNSAEAAGHFWVSTTGTNNGACTISAPCKTIGHALGIASDYDTIHVGGGTFTESIKIKKSITIEGNTSCTPCTNWTGTNNDRAIYIQNASQVTIRRFNILDNVDDVGGALRVGYNSIVTLENVNFVNNHAYTSGGAIYNEGVININQGKIMNNTAVDDGGAIFNDGAIFITGSQILQNSVENGNGGAIVNRLNMDISTSLLKNNGAYLGGGAILNEGDLFIQSSDILSNSAYHGPGGGIFNTAGGDVVVANGEISYNLSESPCLYISYPPDWDCKDNPGGGGVYNDTESTLTLTFVEMYFNKVDGEDDRMARGGAVASLGRSTIAFSTLANNETINYVPEFPTSGASLGGAFYNAGSSEVYNSTFNNNSVDGNDAPALGGGIFNFVNSYMYIENSTISANSADGFSDVLGGGIYNKGTLDVIHITVTENSTGEEGMSEPRGSGIFNYSEAGQLNISNSIVAMNLGSDCLTTLHNFMANNGNLDSDKSCPGFSLGGKDPLLGGLQNNGGPTETHLPAFNSLAVDAISLSLCLKNDQRNFTRPFGDGCDLGAIELNNNDG